MVELAKSQPHGEGRVHIGCGFDYWFLPQPVVVGLFSRLREAGVKLFTTHYCYNPVTGKSQQTLHSSSLRAPF